MFITGTEHQGVIVSDEPASGEYAELVDLRRYARREARVRLHQREFRSRVLFTYADRCCICSLRHRGLLDAAHIVDDAHEQGVALVSNGLAMCCIHHGADDQLVLGINPATSPAVTSSAPGATGHMWSTPSRSPTHLAPNSATTTNVPATNSPYRPEPVGRSPYGGDAAPVTRLTTG